MHQRVYQPNPARANSARYWQGHGIWACQNVQTFLAHEFCWHGSKSVSRQSILTRRSTALSEAQDIQNMIPICRFNRVLCRLSLVYWGSKVFPRFSSMERFENEVAPRPPAGPEPHPPPHHRAGASTGAHPGRRISSERRQFCPRWCAHPGSYTCSLPPRHCQRCPPAQR